MPSELGIAAATSCEACGRADLSAWRRATASDLGLAASQEYVLARCGSCGTAVVDCGARGRETSELYEAGTYADQSRRLLPLVRAVRSLATRDRMRLLRDLPHGARIVDVGCGDGRFLLALRRAGYSATGIEASQSRAAAARLEGLSVEAVPVEHAAMPESSQDAVVFWHSLEHLDGPGAALQLAHRWLRPGGRLVVAAPNLDSVQARLGRDRWFHQDVPRHLTHFTCRGLLALLERSGFDVVRVRHILLEHNVFGMWQTLLNGLTAERDVVYRFVKRSLLGGNPLRSTRDALAISLAGLPLLLLAISLELGAGLAGRGGTIVTEALRR